MSLKSNLLANGVGQAWAGLMGLAFIPLYLRLLGMEAYGLIGLFAVLQAWFAVLDLGMTPTLNREVARYTAGAHSAESIRDLFATFESLCCAVALALAAVIFVLSHWIAADWLRPRSLATGDVARAIALMGVVAALRFVEELYRGALLGFQKHVRLNAIAALAATARGAGAVLVLMRVAATIEAFFLWQVAVSVVSVAVLRRAVRRQLPAAGRRAAFSARAFADVRRFAGGMLLTTLLALLLTQLDKVLLSRLLSLEKFGAYMFASTVAGGLFLLIGPVAQSYFPRFTELVTRGDEAAAGTAYHQAAQLMSIVLVPAGFALAAFGEPLIFCWTRSTAVARAAAPLVAVLSLGTVLNGWMHVPYMMQLAHGWTGLTVRVNAVAVALLVPAILIAVPRFGPIGAAWAWFAVNAGYVLFEIHFMHRRLLRGEQAEWFLQDIGVPTLAAGAVIAAAAILKPDLTGSAADIVWIGLATGGAFLLAAFASSRFRPLLLRRRYGHP